MSSNNKNKTKDQDEANIPSPQSNNQRKVINSLASRVESAKNKVRRDQNVSTQALEVRDIAGRRKARGQQADLRRAETQNRQLSRDANLAYRQAIKRNDRAGAYAIRKDAIGNGIQFGGIRQAGDVRQDARRARANAQLGAELNQDSAVIAGQMHNQFMQNQTAQMNTNPYGVNNVSNSGGGETAGTETGAPDAESHGVNPTATAQVSPVGTAQMAAQRSPFLPRIAPPRLNFNRFA